MDGGLQGRIELLIAEPDPRIWMCRYQGFLEPIEKPSGSASELIHAGATLRWLNFEQLAVEIDLEWL
ncbi:hypothetical protein B0A54_18062, partial [Friedmanniomyces endolithicus]